MAEFQEYYRLRWFLDPERAGPPISVSDLLTACQSLASQGQLREVQADWGHWFALA
jgi:hypothetical protein